MGCEFSDLACVLLNDLVLLSTVAEAKMQVSQEDIMDARKYSCKPMRYLALGANCWEDITPTSDMPNSSHPGGSEVAKSSNEATGC